MRLRRLITRRRLLWLTGAALLLWLLAWFVLPFTVPLPESLRHDIAASPVLLDRHGTPIHHLVLPDYTRAKPVPLEDIPQDLVNATLAAEDRRFHSHGGVDLLATARAVRDWLRRGRPRSGASTITQQLVKISSPPAPRRLPTKFREVLLARRLEMTREKDWILDQYLDRLDYGQLRRGPTEAARHFFQKPLADLSLSECATLAGLPQAPSRLNPLRHPERAKKRRDTVLDRMARHFDYDTETIARARNEPLRLRPLNEPLHAPWLATVATTVATSTSSSISLLPNQPDSPEIHTTIDLPLQQEIERIVTEELAALTGTNARHAAVVVLDNPTGEILALVSSGNWNDPRGGQINGALLPRSPGSALKPFTYLLAFEHGGFYPGSILADVPTRFRTEEGLDAPENYDHIHHGPVTIRRALACSLNVSAMRQLNQLGGPEPLHRLLTNLGLTTIGPDSSPHGLGLTLGNAPVRLLDLTNAYSTVARQGRHLPPTLLRKTSKITNHHSSLITPPFSRTASFLISDILSDPAARAPAFGPAASIRLPFRCAVKTGTSSDVHDNWCLGYTPDLTIGVWVGNFEHDPMTGISGITGAGPIFRRSILAAHGDRPPSWFRPPENLARIEIDPRTGKRVDDTLGGDLPRQPEWCPRDRLPLLATAADYDAEGRVRLGPEFKEWFDSAPLADRSRFTLDTTLPPPRPLRVLAPHNGATYLLDPELPTGGRRLRLATNFPGLARWTSDTLSIEPTEPEPTALLQPGTHTLTATDPRTGVRHEITIHVESL